MKRRFEDVLQEIQEFVNSIGEEKLIDKLHREYSPENYDCRPQQGRRTGKASMQYCRSLEWAGVPMVIDLIYPIGQRQFRY